MRKKVQLWIIGRKIEWHWLFIKRGRKKGEEITDKLLAEGKQLNSPELMAFNARLSRHTNRVTVLTERYKKLSADS